MDLAKGVLGSASLPLPILLGRTEARWARKYIIETGHPSYLTV